MFQQTVIVGNLGGDTILRYAPNGDAVCSFSVAVNKHWTGDDGEKKKKTTWFRVTVWGKQGENADKYLGKGDLVMIVGDLKEPEPYQNKETQEWVANIELTARKVQYLKTGGVNQEPMGVDDDIPF